MPIAAEIMEVNNDLTDTPSIINESPFDKGKFTLLSFLISNFFTFSLNSA